MNYEKYESYRRLRLLDNPALQVYNELKERESKREAMDFPTLLDDMCSGLMVFTIVASVIKRTFIFVDTPLWITSPSGKTTVALPLPIALRVIRKREWDFAKVEPIKPARIISRHEALHILLSGDKPRKGG